MLIITIVLKLKLLWSELNYAYQTKIHTQHS